MMMRLSPTSDGLSGHFLKEDWDVIGRHTIRFLGCSVLDLTRDVQIQELCDATKIGKLSKMRLRTFIWSVWMRGT